jgi:hypothetical protein
MEQQSAEAQAPIPVPVFSTQLGSAELRKLRTPKTIPVGAVIEWEETLCRHRGTYRLRKLTVAQVLGMNLLDTHGDYHYWTEIKHMEAVKCILPIHKDSEPK